MAAFDADGTIINTHYIVKVGPLKDTNSGGSSFHLTLAGGEGLTVRYTSERDAHAARQQLFAMIDAGAGLPL